MRMVEAQLHECAPEAIPTRVRLDGHASQAPGRIAFGSGQGLAADGRDRDDPIILIDGDVQRLWVVITSKTARVGLVVEQNRASKRNDVFGRNSMDGKERAAIRHKYFEIVVAWQCAEFVQNWEDGIVYLAAIRTFWTIPSFHHLCPTRQ